MALAILSWFALDPLAPSNQRLAPLESCSAAADALAMSELNQVPNVSAVDRPPDPERNSIPPPPAVWLAGASSPITNLRAQIQRVAPYFRSALLVGEPGCGEEAVAQVLHHLSPISQRRFISLNAADALPLFREHRSDDALASVGMFYIPRPDRLPGSIQASLLGLARRYGPQAPRIVAFAEHGLRPLVTTNGFSPELAEFLGSLRIAIPPLRDRREDIPQLLSASVQRIAIQSGVPIPQLAPDLTDAARLLPWSGNLPQLRAAAKGLLERANRNILHAPDLDAVLGILSQPPAPQAHQPRMICLEDVVQEHIRSVLFACNGNKLRTAEVLGISRSTLYRMLDAPARPSAPSQSTSLHSSRFQMVG